MTQLTKSHRIALAGLFAVLSVGFAPAASAATARSETRIEKRSLIRPVFYGNKVLITRVADK